jgi:hypothetical protein
MGDDICNISYEICNMGDEICNMGGGISEHHDIKTIRERDRDTYRSVWLYRR